jgi:MacB-like protein
MVTHLRIAIRMLAKRPGLAAGRILTVTIVVTAVSAVFTVANATFLRPLPFPQSDRLVRIYLQLPGTTDFRDANPLDPFEFVRFRGRTRTLERFEGIWVTERAVGDTEPDSVTAGRVSAGFFDLLGGDALVGRVFTEEEVESGARVVVLSHALWNRRFGGQSSAIGATLVIDREPHTIIGVLRPGFDPGFAPSEFWTPLTIPQGGAHDVDVGPIRRRTHEGSGHPARAGREAPRRVVVDCENWAWRGGRWCGRRHGRIGSCGRRPWSPAAGAVRQQLDVRRRGRSGAGDYRRPCRDRGRARRHVGRSAARHSRRVTGRDRDQFAICFTRFAAVPRICDPTSSRGRAVPYRTP